MTSYDVDIGDLDAQDLKWDGGDLNGNAPRCQSPFVPRASQRAWSELISQVEAGWYDGPNVDWGQEPIKGKLDAVVAAEL